jgi:hypothetical protein
MVTAAADETWQVVDVVDLSDGKPELIAARPLQS